MNRDCIFCKISAGQIPCSKVYEDADVLAFMDIHPVTKGHTLVIPREHHDPIMETPVAVLQKVIAVVRKIARAQEKGLKADGINVTQANGEIAGQVIKHIHFHVIPRFGNDPHSWNSPQGSYGSDAEMKDYADRIRNAVG